MEINGHPIHADTCWFLKNGLVAIIADVNRCESEGNPFRGYIHIAAEGRPGVMFWNAFGHVCCDKEPSAYSLDRPVTPDDPIKKFIQFR